jgi:hypothetical protein
MAAASARVASRAYRALLSLLPPLRLISLLSSGYKNTYSLPYIYLNKLISLLYGLYFSYIISSDYIAYSYKLVFLTFRYFISSLSDIYYTTLLYVTYASASSSA